MIGIARICRPLSLLLPALALCTCFLPSEPEDKRLRVTFATHPSPLVVALRDTTAVSLSVLVDGKPATSPVHYVIEPADAHLAVTTDGRAVGLVRGQGGLNVRVVSGSSGANPVDTVLPVSVILKTVVVTKPPDTLTAFGDTLVVRPGYRDARGAPLTPAESAAVVPQFTLVSSGRAVHANGTALVAYANGVDTVQVGVDTAHAAFAVAVRQRATRLRGQPDTLRLIALTETWQLTDSAFDRRSHALGAHTSTWKSADSTIAKTTASGLVTAVANGSALLIGTVDGATDTVPVIVAQAARRIVVSSGGGQTGTVAAPLAAPFVAQLADSLGFAAAIAGVQVTFRVDSGGGSFGGAATATAVSDAQGHVRATLTLGTVARKVNGVSVSGTGLSGAATFTATGGPAAAHHIVLVSGGSQAVGAGTLLPNPIVVSVRDTFDNTVPNQPVVFKITAGGGLFGAVDTVAVMSDSAGNAAAWPRLGQAIGAGVNGVEVRGVGLTTPTVTVTADGLVPVATVEVTPTPASVNVGGTLQLAATLKDSVGGILTGRSARWTSSAAGVATVDATGKVTGVAAGDVSISAVSDEKTGTAAVAVLGPATAVVMTPDTARLVSLDTIRLAAAPRDAAGHVIGGTLTWTTSDGSIAAVTSDGKVTAEFDGTAVVRATLGSLVDSCVVIVTAIPVSKVELQPRTVTLYATGATYQLTATALDAASHPIAYPRFQFSTANPAVATVGGAGLVTAVAAGTTTVSVTSGAASDQITVRVEATQFTCAGTGGTTHSGTITASETWLKAGSPHRISNNWLYVSNGTVLTIQPGALVCFTDGVGIQLNGGRLVAVGTTADHIVFTAADPAHPWGGLYFTGTSSDTSKLSYARIEYVNANANGAVNASTSTHPVVLDSVLIRQVQGYGLSLNGAGSRATSTVVESAALSGATVAAVILGNGALLDGALVQASGREGVSVSGTGVRLNNVRIQGSTLAGLEVQSVGALAQVTQLRIVGGLSYPLRVTPDALAHLTSVPPDSLVGNAADSIVVSNGTFTGARVSVWKVLPWRVEGTVTVDTQAVLVVQPGAHLAMAGSGGFWIQRGGRLEARGTQTSPVVFTALSPSQPWSGFQFNGAASDSSYLTNALVEYANGNNTYSIAVFGANPAHPVVMDSVRFRQIGRTAVQLTAPGSRLSRSVVDTSGTEGNWTAVILGAGTKLQATTIRRSGGVGVDLALNDGLQATVSGNVVTGGLSYPLRAYINQLALLSPADQANLVGNARDSIEMMGGTLTGTTVTVTTTTLPWRMEGGITVDTQAVLVVQPGVRLAFAGGQGLWFQRGGRLQARGAHANPIVFTALSPSQPWSGFEFNGTPPDSSYLTNALVEYADGNSSSNITVFDASSTHPLVLDSVRVRQIGRTAVQLSTPGSRLSRSTIDTSGTEGSWTAVTLWPGTTMEGTTIRRATGLGLDLAGLGSGAQARVSGNVITGGLNYPVRAYINQLALLSPADQANLVGNAQDTIDVSGGTLTSTTLTLTPVLPWRIDNTITVDTQAVLVVQPGVKVVMVGGPSFIFQRGGRLSARGKAASPIVWTRSGTSGYWGGLYFTSNTPPSDSSYLTNARLEYPSQYNGAAVFATGAHPLVLDSVLVRQAQGSAVRLDVAGSRLSRSEIDTAGTGAADNAITLQTGTKVEVTTVRRTSGIGIVVNGPGVRITGTRVLGAAGVGIDASNQTIADFTGSRVTGGGSYPVRVGLGSLQAPGMILDSLLGNASDTLVITGGSARVGSFLDGPSLPWRVEGLVTFDSATVLTVQPGAGMALAQNAQVKFTNSGRLVAHGTAHQPVRFTAVNPANPWGGLTFEGRSGVYLGGMPRDTSVLINARLEYGGTYTAVQSSGKHVVLIDSTEIRQSAGQAVYLNSPLSRISRSSVDTTTSGSAAVSLGDSTYLDTVTVRRAANTGVYVMGSHVHLAGASVFQAQGTGLDAGQGQLTQGTPVRVTGSALYPLRTTLDNLRFIMPDTVAQDSLRGNGKDTVLIVGGTLTSSSQVMRQVLPWVFQGTGFFEGGAVLTILPGIAFQMPSGVSLYFQNGGRLIARGTAALPIQFAPSDIANPWNGLLFQGSPGDSSYLTNVVVFRAQGTNGWAVQARDSHPLVMDSVSVRQSRYNGVDLESPGSRFSRSTVDTTSRNNSGVRDNSGVGLYLGSNTLAEGSTIRNAGGVGLQAYGATAVRVVKTRMLGSGDVGIDAGSGLVDLTGTRVTGGASYPMRGQIQSIALAVADSMLGNARDSLDINGGTLTAATATATPTMPWRVDGGFTVDTQAVLSVQPGAHLAMASSVGFWFQRGGRLQARGAQGNPIVFTAQNPSQPWSGFYFSSTPPDSSYLTNALIEYADGNNTGNPVVDGASSTHPVILDSVRVRQAGRNAVVLNAPGSRLSRSTIDTAGTEGTWTGVELASGVKMEGTTVRHASGLGLDLAIQGNVVQAALTGNVITGGLSYPLRAYVEQLARVSAADQANLVGNARDTLEISGGTLTGTTLTVTPALPWRVEGWVNVDTQAVLVVQPGGRLSMAGNVALLFVRGGRLNARGASNNPVKFGAISPSQPWSGMSFNSNSPSDSSYLTNAVVEYANGYNTASAAVYGASSNYPVVLDTTRIRQSSRSAVVLNGVGSRLTRSTIDTSGTEGAYAAVMPGTGAKVEATTIRRAGGVGLDLTGVTGGSQAAVTGNVVTGGLGYPVQAYPQQAALISETDQAGLVGNARDSIRVMGGTLSGATLTMSASLPWLMAGSVDVDTGAGVVVRAGAHLAMDNGVGFRFQRGARVQAIGTSASPIVFTHSSLGATWGGLYFHANTAPSDSSRILNARIEYATYPSAFTGRPAAVVVESQHALALDSVLIRQASDEAVSVNTSGGGGLRMSRSQVDTSGFSGYDAVALTGTATLESTRIRHAGNYGIVVYGNTVTFRDCEVVDGLGGGFSFNYSPTVSLNNCNIMGNAANSIANNTGATLTLGNIWWGAGTPGQGTNGYGISGSAVTYSTLAGAVTIPVPFP